MAGGAGKIKMPDSFEKQIPTSFKRFLSVLAFDVNLNFLTITFVVDQIDQQGVFPVIHWNAVASVFLSTHFYTSNQRHHPANILVILGVNGRDARQLFSVVSVTGCAAF